MCQFTTGEKRNKFLTSLSIILIIALVFSSVLTPKTTLAQVPPGEFGINNGGIYTPQYLVENILIGEGVEVSNITFTGNNLGIGYFHGESTTGLNRGVVLSSGKCVEIDNNEVFKADKPLPPGNGDVDLQTVGSRCNSEFGFQNSSDATILEFDFVPQSTEVKFRYVFGSEEYPASNYQGFVGQRYNDSFGFFISGPGLSSFDVYTNDARNIALVPNSSEEVCINSINGGSNSQYFTSNVGGTNGVCFGGHTTILIATAKVKPCFTYHIKLAIADIADNQYDSGVFLEANSFSSVGVQTSVDFTHAVVDTAVEACNDARVGFALSGKTLGDMTIHYRIEGTAQNGIDYLLIPDSVIVQSLDSIAFIDIIPINDAKPEDYESVDFIYNTSLCDPPVWDTTTVWIKDNFPLNNSDSDDPGIYCSQSATIYAGASEGQMPYTYTWTPAPDTTDVITVRPDTTTTYSYSITDVCGHNVTGDIVVTVLPPEATVENFEISLCLGNSTQLGVQGGNFWKWTASPFDPTLTVDTLQFPTVAPTDTTVYTVVVSDSCGNTNTANITVYVGDIVASISTLTPVICVGQSAILEANYVPDAIYEWYDSNGVSVGNEITCEVYPSADMTYRVVITDMNCGGATDDEFFTVQVTQMFLSSSNDTIVCPLQEVNLTSSSSLGGGTFVWEDEAGNILGQSPSISVYPEDPTMYIVTVTDGCTKRDTVQVDIYPLPNVTASATASAICPQESLTLQAVGNAAMYEWSAVPVDNTLVGQENSLKPTISPTQNTLYTLTGTSINGCISSSDIQITIKEKKTAEFNTSSAFACEGEDITFMYSGNANTSASYQWDFDGINRTGQGHSINWPAMGTKTVTLVVTQDLCISDPISHTVEVKPTPIANFTYGNTKGCVPLTVDFTDASTNTATGVSYYWDFGAGGSSSNQSPSFEFANPGKFDVTLKVTNPGCENSMIIPLLVDAWPVPVAGFTADPMKVSLKNPNITFNSTSTGDNLSYQWETGDGFTYDTSTFVHTYSDSGYYNVKLVTENSFGCFDEFINVIHITPKYLLRIPTAFTPNGDGKNDDFKISGNGVKKFRITIYNSWGTLIFASNNIEESWDGKVNGQPALPGLYVYHTYFMDDNDEESKQTGSFILIK